MAYSWDFGDGGTGTGANPVHVFAPGTHTVTLTVTDNRGGTGQIAHDVTVTGSAGINDQYGKAVIADNPEFFWRFGESSGNAANDSSGAVNPGTFYNGYTLGQPGALPISDTSVKFDGSAGFASSNASYNNPSVYSEEAWFNTTTNRGGKIIGFGSVPDGSSNHYDRHVYMQDDGTLVFGAYTGQIEHDHVAERLQQRPVAPRGGDAVRRRHEAVRRRCSRRHEPADRQRELRRLLEGRR